MGPTVPDASTGADATPDASVADASTTDAAPDAAPDTTPPVFGGLLSAKADSTELDLQWEPAYDDRSRSNAIYYRVYVSTSPGGPSKGTAPTVVTDPAAFSAIVTGVSSGTTYYVVVRAVDQAGNEDANMVELTVTTLTSLATDVQPIFTTNCALTSCHVPGSPPQGLILQEGYTYASTVDQIAREGALVNRPDIKRIDSKSADPWDSFLWWTIQDPLPTMLAGATTSVMPPPVTGRMLTDEQRGIIADWIRQGARNN